MDKRAFIKHVRTWQAAEVEQALTAEPELSRFADKSGKTALHHCASINGKESHLRYSASVKTARALLNAGADVNADRVIIDDGEPFNARPLWYAVAWGKNFALAEFLLENGAEPIGCMWAIGWAGDEKMARLLRRYGADVDPVFRGQTPLLEIVKVKRFKLVRWFVENGADINFKDEQGSTALHYAIKRNHNLVQIEELLKLGANPNLAAKDGTTALSCARRLGKAKVTALLEKYS